MLNACVIRIGFEINSQANSMTAGLCMIHAIRRRHAQRIGHLPEDIDVQPASSRMLHPLA